MQESQGPVGAGRGWEEGKGISGDRGMEGLAERAVVSSPWKSYDLPGRVIMEPKLLLAQFVNL